MISNVHVNLGHNNDLFLVYGGIDSIKRSNKEVIIKK